MSLAKSGHLWFKFRGFNAAMVNARSVTEFLSRLIKRDRRFFPMPDLLQLQIETIAFVAIVLKRLWELQDKVRHEGDPPSLSQIESLCLHVELDKDEGRHRAATELPIRLALLGF